MKKKIKSFLKDVKHEIRSLSQLNKSNQIHKRTETSSTERLVVQRKFMKFQTFARVMHRELVYPISAKIINKF